jgi:deazaflavin-dependent oxidoreductase (nitroreductase family)
MRGFANRMILRQFRRGGMRTQGGIPTFLLETIGARTGQVRRCALGYIEEEPGSWLVIGSASGAAWNPAWMHNLAKQPDATIEFDDGRRIDVRAESPAGPDLEAAWVRIGRDAPEYVKYRSKTDREMPVVRLRRR